MTTTTYLKVESSHKSPHVSISLNSHAPINGTLKCFVLEGKFLSIAVENFVRRHRKQRFRFCVELSVRELDRLAIVEADDVRENRDHLSIVNRRRRRLKI